MIPDPASRTRAALVGLFALCVACVSVDYRPPAPASDPPRLELEVDRTLAEVWKALSEYATSRSDLIEMNEPGAGEFKASFVPRDMAVYLECGWYTVRRSDADFDGPYVAWLRDHAQGTGRIVYRVRGQSLEGDRSKIQINARYSAEAISRGRRRQGEVADAKRYSLSFGSAEPYTLHIDDEARTCQTSNVLERDLLKVIRGDP